MRRSMRAPASSPPRWPREGIGDGDTVSVMLANTPGMLEAHYGVPMAGGVLHSINTRLDANAVAFMLDHAGSKVLIGDTEFGSVLKQALKQTKVKPLLIDYRDMQCGVEGTRLGNLDYEDFIAGGDPDYRWSMPSDEWNAISLNYTSGTTGNPKGVVYHHRGAALMCYANTLATGMGQHPIYLWTLPMFHCNGWCFPWTISLLAGTHVCLRSVRAKQMYEAIAKHGVTHLSGAPFVMSALLNATEEERRPFDQRVAFNHAAAPPPAAVLAKMDEAGFELTHLYGLTETYGPATLNEWHAAWDELPEEDRLAKRIRQGVRYHALEDLTVMHPETMEKVAADGETLGEVMFRGNIVMKGYLKNETGDRGGLRRRLVPFRRSRRAASRRLHPAQGPLQGHHHLGRREHLIDRGRGRSVQAPGGRRRGGRRQARREMGRDAVRLRRAQAGRERDRAGDHRLVPRQPRPLQMPAPRRVRRSAQDLDRQDPEIQAARAGEERIGVLAPLAVRASSRRPGGLVPVATVTTMATMSAMTAMATVP